MTEAKIKDYERDEVVGRIDETSIHTDDELLREELDDILTDEGSIWIILPGEEAGEYKEYEVQPEDSGYVRKVIDNLPSPFDIGNLSKLDDLPLFDPEEQDKRKRRLPDHLSDKIASEAAERLLKEGVSSGTAGVGQAAYGGGDEEEDEEQKSKSSANRMGRIPDNITEDVEKKRVYVDDPSDVPEGYEPQEGPQGGIYYEAEPGEEGKFTEKPISSLDEFRERLNNAEVASREARPAFGELNEVTFEDGSKAFTVPAGTSSADRRMIGSKAVRQLGGNAPPHVIKNNKVFIDNVAGEQLGQAPESLKEQVDRGQALHEIAANIIAGNSDLHGGNFRITDEGELSVFDMDETGKNLDELDKDAINAALVPLNNELDFDISKEEVLDKIGNLLESNDLIEVVGNAIERNEDIGIALDNNIRELREKTRKPDEGDEKGLDPLITNLAETAAEKLEKGNRETFADIDDELMKLYENIVWWDDDISKAPEMWRHDEGIPDFVEEYIKEAIREGAFYDGDIEDLTRQEQRELERMLEEKMTQKQGWSLASLKDAVTDEFGYAEGAALITIRNETAAIANKAREEAYKDRDDYEEYKFYWTGPDDMDTTPICEFMKNQTNPRFGGEPVTLEKMEELLHEAIERFPDFKGSTPERVDDWLPHFQCRHTFTRQAWSSE